MWLPSVQLLITGWASGLWFLVAWYFSHRLVEFCLFFILLEFRRNLNQTRAVIFYEEWLWQLQLFQLKVSQFRCKHVILMAYYVIFKDGFSESSWSNSPVSHSTTTSVPLMVKICSLRSPEMKINGSLLIAFTWQFLLQPDLNSSIIS